MRKLFLALLLLASFPAWAQVGQIPLAVIPTPLAAYFVSTTGSDGNPGTLAAPFLTLGKCQTAMRSSPAKTCFVRGGVYSLAASIVLTSADAGETWSYYPPDGIDSPALTQTSAFAYFLLSDGANNIAITGFAATGFQHVVTTTCGNTVESSFVFGPTTVSGATANFTATHNALSNFDCGIALENATNPIVSYNTVSVVEYAALNCDGCTGSAGQTVWQGNVIYDVDPDQQGSNGYGIVFSPNYNTNYISRNFTMRQNSVYNSANWVCLNNHAGANIWWVSNLCVRSRGDGGGYSEGALSAALTLSNPIQASNIWDEGVETSAIDTYVQCGYVLPCASNTTGVTGGQLANNFVLNNLSSCVMVFAPTVTANNPVAPYCNTIPPETVSSIDFGGFAHYGFAPGQPNAVVATLVAHMSNTLWDFPTPPGSFLIGGANSGGFVVCHGNQICQRSTGTPAGTYADFSITATLHGMAGSPVTIAAGTLTLTSNAFFVSAGGNDTNPGSFAAPFATLGKCQAAMRAGPGKTCFIRAGAYAPAPSSATAIGCNNGSTPANIVELTHVGGDDGEVWSYYPPDGVDQAVFDGSSSIPTAFCAYHVKNVTVTGLAFQHFQQSPLYLANWDANDGNGAGDTFSANTVASSVTGGGNPAVNISGWVPNASVLNNAVQDVGGQGIGASTTQASAQAGLNGLTIQGNAILNSCTAVSDCGPLYVQDYQRPASSPITIRNNYAYQVNAAGTGGNGIYLDDGASNVAASGNVIAAGGALASCFLIHGGSNDTFWNNVCDEGAGSNILFYQQTTLPNWRYGAFNDFNSGNPLGGFEGPLQTFETWLGQPIHSAYTVAYSQQAFDCIGGGTACMTNTGAITNHSNYWVSINRPNIVWSIGLTGCDHAVNIVPGNQCAAGHTIPLTGANSIASGFEDSVWNTVFSTIRSVWPNAIIRIGWEMNLACCTGPWLVGQAGGSTSTGVDYIAAYRHVAAIAQSWGFKLDWCPNLGVGAAPAANFYPGDAYVDIVGQDFYDAVSPGHDFPFYRDETEGLASWAAFALAHGNKPLAYDEWGCAGSISTDAHCANIITGMGAWLNGHNSHHFNLWNSQSAPNLATQICDNGTVNTCGPPYQNPLSAAAFLTQFTPFAMAGNSVRGNTIVCSSGSTCGNGYVGSLSPPVPADTNSNLYWNYGSSTAVKSTGSGGAAGDANPIAVNAGLTCWALGRSFGPPGFQIPQIGTPPSWPHGC